MNSSVHKLEKLVMPVGCNYVFAVCYLSLAVLLFRVSLMVLFFILHHVRLLFSL